MSNEKWVCTKCIEYEHSLKHAEQELDMLSKEHILLLESMIKVAACFGDSNSLNDFCSKVAVVLKKRNLKPSKRIEYYFEKFNFVYEDVK